MVVHHADSRSSRNLYWAWLSSEDMFSADRETLAKAFLPLYGCALLSLVSASIGWRRSVTP